MAIVTDTEFGGIELGMHPNRLTFEVMSHTNGSYVKLEKACLPFVEPRMHVAAVIDGDEIRLFKNGKLAGRQPFDGKVGLSPFSMRIGCSPHPVTECHEMFRGRIDDVRFSSAALYSEEFTPAPKLDASQTTVALYNFNEGQGDVAKDASGNGHDGIIHDARWVRISR
jgi:hypothetical protein